MCHGDCFALGTNVPGSGFAARNYLNVSSFELLHLQAELLGCSVYLSHLILFSAIRATFHQTWTDAQVLAWYPFCAQPKVQNLCTRAYWCYVVICMLWRTFQYHFWYLRARRRALGHMSWSMHLHPRANERPCQDAWRLLTCFPLKMPLTNGMPSSTWDSSLSAQCMMYGLSHGCCAVLYVIRWRQGQSA